MFNGKRVQMLESQVEQLQATLRQADRKLNAYEESEKTLYKRQAEVDNLQDELAELQEEIKHAQEYLDSIDEELALKEAGFSEQPLVHDTCGEYLRDIAQVKVDQREMLAKFNCIKNKEILDDCVGFEYRLYRGLLTSVLEAFSLKTDSIISNITPNNYSSSLIKIDRAYAQANNRLKDIKMLILPQYRESKVAEARLVYELKIKQIDEKEQKRRQDEIIKDSIKAEQELSKAQKKLQQDLVSAQYEYNKRVKENQDTTLIQETIDEIQKQIDHNTYALSNTKAGYVYVVSNSDMKEGQYKVGITRRNVEDRMKELGSGASHSFGMNVHSFVFVDNVFEVESAVHNHLADKRVNRLNPRKEWFYCTLDDIANAFKQTSDIDIIFDDSPDIYDPNYLASKNYFDFL